jgi:hypothetical protein
MGLMKGVLSDSDIKILSSAAAAIDYGTSEDAFKAEIQRIIDKVKPVAEAPTEQMSSVSSGQPMGGMRTDRHNNPTAMTIDVAKTLGLVKGKDYVEGDPFDGGVTARLIGDPYKVTISALDKAAADPNVAAFYTGNGKQRWTHTAILDKDWVKLSEDGKRAIVSDMYKKEGGSGYLMQYALGQSQNNG